ncbi:MAG: ATP-binding protein [Pseudomonadales bacterium]|nr:ATP-binding protein [Pseudomonadales bacterium]
MTPVFTNKPDELPKVIAELHRLWTQAGLPDEAVMPFEIALEELFYNTVRHGIGDITSTLLLEIEDSAIILHFESDGQRFDPFTEAKQPNFSNNVDDLEIGGLGIHLVKQLMDQVNYEWRDQKNKVQLRAAKP